ncbi:AGAP001226-PA [Anopheles gambiae str. PEST]|uniref:AGAP001226-PA n=1 Tax=Anopheles gambiae TaxID=7165 RepID=A7UVR0_ANOGA|nr:AGAP001226-PA [Anopheles gambiae str. PEST]
MAEMDFQFKYECLCTNPKSIRVNDIHNTDYQRRIKERMNEIVDRSWDETDPSILSQLTMLSQCIPLTSNVNATLPDITIPDHEKGLAIMKSVSNELPPSGCSCACEAISNVLSTVLDAGLAEVNIEPLREQSLLEKVQLLKPFVPAFHDDVSLCNFFMRAWKQAVRFYCPRLVGELAQVYPQFLEPLVDALMKVQDADYGSLQLLKEFQFLARCLTIGESFYAILSYLAKQDRVRAQSLISACIRSAKDQLSSKEYYALFPPAIRPYAIVMNEIINPNDTDVEMLIGQLRSERPHEYKILMMISPVFCCLDDALPEAAS